MKALLRMAVANVVRHGLTAGAAVLVAKGVADTAVAEQLVGGGMAVVSVGWSLLEKNKLLNKF